MGKNENTASNLVEMETTQTVKHRLKTKEDNVNFYRAWSAASSHAEAIENLQEFFPGLSGKDASTLASQVRRTLGKSLKAIGESRGLEGPELSKFVAEKNVQKFRSTPINLDDFAASL